MERLGQAPNLASGLSGVAATTRLETCESKRGLAKRSKTIQKQELSCSALHTEHIDGHLRVFKWPDMEVMLDRSDAHESIKDLDFSSDGKLLASLGSTGPCRIWDLASSTTVASLPREKGDNFVFCRFSQDNQLLYVATIKQGKGVIMSWDTTSWKIAGARQIVHDSISAFNISADGKLLAIGTTEGDIVIVDSFNLQVRKTVKKAHLFFVTTVEFSRDDRALVSVSSDSSARVTVIEDQNQRATGMWVVVFVIILLAMLIFYIKSGAFH